MNHRDLTSTFSLPPHSTATYQLVQSTGRSGGGIVGEVQKGRDHNPKVFGVGLCVDGGKREK